MTAQRPPTSSPASAAGPSPCALQAGLQLSLSGLGPAPASHSAPRGGGSASTTPATSGPSGCASSPSAALQCYLESRLRAELEGLGSPAYVVTWKPWVMPSGAPICALRASALRTHASGSIGVRSGWPTPTASDGTGAQASSKQGGPSLRQVAGWSTPTASDSRGSRRQGYDCGHPGSTLTDQARLVVPGSAANGCPAGTASSDPLNPEFVRWLMGYPAEWGSCAGGATPSCPSSPPPSSEPLGPRGGR
jgi:hypothetical protein